MRNGPEQADPQTYAIIGAAMEDHRELGCGLLENAYQEGMEVELRLRAIPFRREVSLPIFYKGQRLRCFYKCDFLCYDSVVVELKALRAITDVERAQIIHYLKASKMGRALVLNFGPPSLQYERFIHG